MVEQKTIGMENITKVFPDVVACRDIDFDLKQGEIHGLVGENGAGKTTLMNILNGSYLADEGKIFIDGEEVDINNPLDAIEHGIGMVHQERKLVDEMSVLDNILLNHHALSPIVDYKEGKKRVEKFCDEYGFELDLESKVVELEASEKQKVEIVKTLFKEIDFLVLDEPISVLAPQEVEEFLETIRKLVDKGHLGIVIVSHRLNVIQEICDRVTILRGGEKIGKTREVEGLEREKMIKMMIGEKIMHSLDKSDIEPKGESLKVENLYVKDKRGLDAVKGVSFAIKENEIFGIAGISGNGQSQLAEVLMGLRKAESGKILYRGEDITRMSTKDRWKMGMAYIPSDRLEIGCVGGYSLEENTLLNYWFDRFRLDKKNIKEITKRGIDEYNVKCDGPQTLAMSLSGGNLQKYLLSRVQSKNPEFLIAELPTHGLDVQSMEMVQQEILHAKKNATVFLISEKLDEILSVSDRIAIIRDGKFVDIIENDGVSKEELGEKMLGG